MAVAVYFLLGRPTERAVSGGYSFDHSDYTVHKEVCVHLCKYSQQLCYGSKGINEWLMLTLKVF